VLIHLKVFGFMFRPHCGHLQAIIYKLSAFNVRAIWDPTVCTIVMCNTLKLYTLWDPILYAYWRYLIYIYWPEDGRNAVETWSQKLLNVLALIIVYFIILLLCLTWNINTHTYVRPSIRRSAWNDSAHNGRIFMKFDISIFFENTPGKSKFY